MCAEYLCPEHYTLKTAYSCFRCKRTIEGTVQLGPGRGAERRQYHPNCFACERCSSKLQAGLYYNHPFDVRFSTFCLLRVVAV